jgi:hypothetical protein
MVYGACSARPYLTRGACNNGTQHGTCQNTNGTKYGTCQNTNGTEYREVTCQTYGNNTLTIADSYCAEVEDKPSTEQYCEKECSDKETAPCQDNCSEDDTRSCYAPPPTPPENECGSDEIYIQ